VEPFLLLASFISTFIAWLRETKKFYQIVLCRLDACLGTVIGRPFVRKTVGLHGSRIFWSGTLVIGFILATVTGGGDVLVRLNSERYVDYQGLT